MPHFHLLPYIYLFFILLKPTTLNFLTQKPYILKVPMKIQMCCFPHKSGFQILR